MNERIGVTDHVSIKVRPAAEASEPSCLLTITGVVEAVLKGENGEVKERRQRVLNTVVNGGKYAIADQLLSNPTMAKPTHMGIGTGSTAAAVSDSALEGEVGTRSAIVKSRTNNMISSTATFGAGNGTGDIKEAGIFTAANGGVLYSRVVFGVITKGANDSLDITWTWTIN